MAVVEQLAKHLRAVYFGGNWTAVNLKDALADVSWQEATTEVGRLHTIATLVFHAAYYLQPILQVLRGEPLAASDKLSFDVPPLTSAADWQNLITTTLTEAERLATQIEKLDEATLFADFADPKYGSYYRNLHGLIEHTHYHLGQISLLKKILRDSSADG